MLSFIISALAVSSAAAKLGARRALDERPKPDQEGTCCLSSSHPGYGTEMCVPCDEEAPADTFCGRNKYNCEKKCAAYWCSDSDKPTAEPTAYPTMAPTAEPTAYPTMAPTAEPTASPTVTPSPYPTPAPTPAPTDTPTAAPPTPEAPPTRPKKPTMKPTKKPTKKPTMTPTVAPTAVPPTPEAPPTKPKGSRCCLWSSDAKWPDKCPAVCEELAPMGSFCALSRKNCETICSDAKWCPDADDKPDDDDKKPPVDDDYKVPTDGFCCFYAANPKDACGTCETMAEKGSWCAESAYQCNAHCGGDVGSATWCPTKK